MVNEANITLHVMFHSRNTGEASLPVKVLSCQRADDDENNELKRKKI